MSKLVRGIFRTLRYVSDVFVLSHGACFAMLSSFLRIYSDIRCGMKTPFPSELYSGHRDRDAADDKGDQGTLSKET